LTEPLIRDSGDYMRMYTPLAKDVRQRPAVVVIYEPKTVTGPRE
jgi:hypothetical protein